MSQLDEVVERVRVEADALYAFVLTRRGQVVTKGGPSEIAEAGRTALAAAADLVAGTDRVVTVKLSHGEIVQRAGRLALDCHVGVAAGRAVLCLVVRGGIDPRRATTALQVGLRAIEPMISRAISRSGGKDLAEAAAAAVAAASDKPAKKLKDSSPRLSVEPARRVGSRTGQAIEKEIAKSGTHVPNPHIPREVLRTTLPWRDPSYATRTPAEPPAEGSDQPSPDKPPRPPRNKKT